MNNFSMIILTIGIPGSGKTYWVNEYKKTHPLTFVVSTDAIRLELTGHEECIDPSQNDLIHEEARKRVKEILENPEHYNGSRGLGPEIIVDSTNVDVLEWIKYKQLGATLIICKLFNTTPEQAMKNQEKRERVVPLDILVMKWETLEHNKKFLPNIFNMIL